MGYIKEPKGVNLVVDPRPLTTKDRSMINDAIAHYKATGKKKRFTPKKRVTSSPKK
jgi:hypothetical protein